MKYALARQRWWMLRVVMMPVHVFVFVVVAFFFVRLIPGDPVTTIVGGANVSQAQHDKIAREYGFAGSLWSQFVTYLDDLVHLDFGRSLASGVPVMTEFSTRFPATLELVVLGLVLSCALALVLSYFVLTHPGNWVATVVRAWARASGAIPEFVLAVLFIAVFYVVLRWAPAPIGLLGNGMAAPNRVTGMPLLDALLTGNMPAAGSIAAHLVLPLIVMMLTYSDLLVKHLVSQLDKELTSPVTRFRIASGAPRGVVVRSIYRRALPSSVTILGVMFGSLLGGVVLLETLFNFSGIGSYAVQAASSVDLPVLLAFMIVSAVISLFVFLLTDVANMMLDPRRKSGRKAAA